MNQRKIPQIKNKFLRIFLGTMCGVVLLVFIAWVIIWIIWWHKSDIQLMKLSLWLAIISGIFMWILHIIYFRTPKKLKKILFEK